MPFLYFLEQIWRWIADTGINLAIIVILALLVPRAGRLAERIIARDLKKKSDEEETKNNLAMTGVAIYVIQIIAYFVLSVAFLQQLGFSLAGAAIPATVASAAVGFGAQSIIADFLAGFFILTEKQYGVGDWVTFQGNGVDVQGTVIQVTMRATQIRTLSQETIVVPNSTARVSINASNYWSRAVVVMPVPLLGSDSAGDAVQRSEAATRRALAQEDIAPALLGELDVHPAVAVNPPSTVGMPWTMDMRFMIQVTAGSQWMVERAIRLELLGEFWDEYGSATTVSGELRDTKTKAPTSSEHSRQLVEDPRDVPTEKFDAATADTNTETNTEQTTVLPAATAASTASTARTAAAGEQRSVDKDDSADELADNHDPAAISAAQQTEEDEESEEPSGWRWWISGGGRMRPSTAILLILLLVLITIRALMATGETADGETFSGILAPPRTEETQTEELAPDTTAPPAEPQAPVNPQPQEPTYPPEPVPTEENPQQPAPAATAPAQPTGAPNPVPGDNNTATTAPVPQDNQPAQQPPASAEQNAGANRQAPIEHAPANVPESESERY